MRLHTGCTDTVAESALKVDSGSTVPCRTGESNPRKRPAGLMLYHLSYIPIPTGTGTVFGVDGVRGGEGGDGEGMKYSVRGREQLERKNSWQYTKHIRLYSDPPQA